MVFDRFEETWLTMKWLEGNENVPILRILICLTKLCLNGLGFLLFLYGSKSHPGRFTFIYLLIRKKGAYFELVLTANANRFFLDVIKDVYS